MDAIGVWAYGAATSRFLPVVIAATMIIASILLLKSWYLWSLKSCQRNRISILFGTQSGTAERFARQLAADLAARYHDESSVVVNNADSVDPESLGREKMACLIMATYGDGEPTDDAAEFCEWLTQKCACTKPNADLTSCLQVRLQREKGPVQGVIATLWSMVSQAKDTSVSAGTPFRCIWFRK